MELEVGTETTIPRVHCTCPRGAGHVPRPRGYKPSKIPFTASLPHPCFRCFPAPARAHCSPGWWGNMPWPLPSQRNRETGICKSVLRLLIPKPAGTGLARKTGSWKKGVRGGGWKGAGGYHISAKLSHLQACEKLRVGSGWLKLCMLGLFF